MLHRHCTGCRFKERQVSSSNERHFKELKLYFYRDQKISTYCILRGDI